MRVILHVDMDAFFAAVEQRDHPEYRGQPVVVGAPPDRRGVVAASSYEARKFGIHSAMPSREAVRRCPHAIFLPPDFAKYTAASRQVMAIFARFTPFVEPLSIDEAFLDVTGSRGLFGDGPAIARKIRAAIRQETGLTASVGVAANKFLAKLASDMHKPDGLTIVPDAPEEILRFLAPLPVGRIWGVGKVTGKILATCGFLSMGDLQRSSLRRLTDLFGATTARHIWQLAHGRDDRPVDTETEEKSISRESTYDTDCADNARIAATLADLVDSVGTRLRKAGKYCTVAKLKLRWDNFETLTRQQTLQPPCCDDFTLRATARELLAGVPRSRPVRLIGFCAAGLTRHPAGQLALPLAAGPDALRKEKLSRAVDRIRRRYGPVAIQRLSPVSAGGAEE